MSAEKVHFVYVKDVGNINMSIDKFAYCWRAVDHEGCVGLLSECGEVGDEFCVGCGCGYEECCCVGGAGDAGQIIPRAKNTCPGNGETFFCWVIVEQAYRCDGGGNFAKCLPIFAKIGSISLWQL